MHCSALCDDRAVADGSTGLVQRGAEDCQEDNGRDDRFEPEEILDLSIRNTQEWQLEQKVQEEGNKSGC